MAVVAVVPGDLCFRLLAGPSARVASASVPLAVAICPPAVDAGATALAAGAGFLIRL